MNTEEQIQELAVLMFDSGHLTLPEHEALLSEWFKTQTFAQPKQHHVNWGEVSGKADFVIHKMEVYDTEGNLLQCVNLKTQYRPKDAVALATGE